MPEMTTYLHLKNYIKCIICGIYRIYLHYYYYMYFKYIYRSLARVVYRGSKPVVNCSTERVVAFVNVDINPICSQIT